MPQCELCRAKEQLLATCIFCSRLFCPNCRVRVPGVIVESDVCRRCGETHGTPTEKGG